MASVRIPTVDPSTGRTWTDVTGTGTGTSGLDQTALGALHVAIEVYPVLNGSTYSWAPRPAYAGPVHFVDNPPGTDAGDPGNTGAITGGGGMAPGAHDQWIEFV